MAPPFVTCCTRIRRNLFKGHLVIHSGGTASGFKNNTEGDSYDEDGVCLFHVKGTQPDNTYGVQVCCVVLCSRGMFLQSWCRLFSQQGASAVDAADRVRTWMRRKMLACCEKHRQR